jgi:hypothetical protein
VTAHTSVKDGRVRPGAPGYGSRVRKEEAMDGERPELDQVREQLGEREAMDGERPELDQVREREERAEEPSAGEAAQPRPPGDPVREELQRRGTRSDA